MSDTPKTYPEIAEVINEYFADLEVRIKAVQSFCLAMVLENAMTNSEVLLLKAELEGVFQLGSEE